MIERALILEDDDEITMKYVPRAVIEGLKQSIAEDGQAFTAATAQFRLPVEGIALEDVEMELVRQAIERSGGNQTKAAELLGISRDQLRYRLKKLEEHAHSAVPN